MLTKDLDATRQPLDRARHVPGFVYDSPEVYAREKDRLFMKEWLAVAREEEIARPGDYMTFRVMGEPLVMVRDRAGVVHALANVCAHRGVEVATGEGNLTEFKCPYHAWTYDLGGQLLGAPFMKETPGFDTSACRLPRLQVGTWAGWVWVNFDPTAEPLMTFLSDFAADVGFLRMEDCVIGTKLVLDLPCNWKLVVENLIDVYHVQVVHAKSFGAHRGSPDKYPMHLRKYGGTCTIYDAAPMTPDGKTRFRRMPAVADRPDSFAISAHLSPNLQVIARSDNVHPLVMWPLAPDATRMIVYNLYPRAWADEPDFKEKVQVYHDYTHVALAEDREMVASLQNGVGSTRFVPGRMSFLEKGIHHVLTSYLERVFDDSSRPAGGERAR
jgi:phenylpropionate dioxygenase-like ring-hydroxylating dioxygenase large terminal subunit